MLTILLADPCDSMRTKLKNRLACHPQVNDIYETTTYEAAQRFLATSHIDLLIISSSLVSDINLLPRGRFLIVATERDDHLLQEAALHGGRGYLLQSAPLDLFAISLQLSAGQFLCDPSLTALDLAERSLKREWVSVAPHVPQVRKLTAREQEIFALACAGFSSQFIAQHLQISYETVKTHLKNIYRKLDLEGRGTRLQQSLRTFEREGTRTFPSKIP